MKMRNHQREETPAGPQKPFFLVRLGRCLRGLLRDPRVPWTAKVEIALLGLYLSCPVDIIPDFLPGLGHLDDVLLVVWVLRRFVRRVGWDLLREHWGSDTQALAQVIEGKKEAC
jgi:uncharacterized membrane protein YkvA (DUF1232 family)